MATPTPPPSTSPSTPPLYQSRVLPPAEWDRIRTECPDSPLAAIDLSTAYGHVVVVERAGRIVGHWPLFLVWHAEPLYIDPASRTPGAVRTLVQGLQRAIAEQRIPVAFAMIEDEGMRAMAERLGFTPTEAPMYHAVAPPEALPHMDVAALVGVAPPPKE